MEKKNIEDLLEDISVLDEWENETSEILKGWYSVANKKGIIAYFGDETDAYMFRLDYINKILNN